MSRFEDWDAFPPEEEEVDPFQWAEDAEYEEWERDQDLIDDTKEEDE